MSKHQSENDFFILRQGNRAMVSLGPLSANRHCPYSCAFCYVQDDFQSYAAVPEDHIISFLSDNRDKYNIIYISGDTDSFAPPRTEKGLHLLLRISQKFDCDLLFTTRTIFNDSQIDIIKNVVEIQTKKGKQLYACISITRYSDSTAYLEPLPIPSPDARIDTLKALHKIGAITVLAMRPFLPVVPVEDYLTILDKARDSVDIALGEYFYFIRNGKICGRVFPRGIHEEIEKYITKGNKMSFDINNSDWDIWYSAEYEKAVREKCGEYGIVFAMHSEDAIKELKSTR